MAGKQAIITVASPKGGVGKTTLAYELAALFKAVLVDLDWDMGGATGMVGDDPEKRTNSLLLTGLQLGKGPTPKPLHIPGRPAVVPSDSRLSELRVDPERVVDRLEAWADEWEMPLVVDTHPGTGSLADGAMLAADVIAVPIVLGAREMEALGGFLRRVHGANLPLVIVPNRWRALRAEIPFLQLLSKWSDETGIMIAPPIQELAWLSRRQRRAALSLVETPGVEVKKAAAQFNDVAIALVEYLKGGQE